MLFFFIHIEKQNNSINKEVFFNNKYNKHMVNRLFLNDLSIYNSYVLFFFSAIVFAQSANAKLSWPHLDYLKKQYCISIKVQ